MSINVIELNSISKPTQCRRKVLQKETLGLAREAKAAIKVTKTLTEAGLESGKTRNTHLESHKELEGGGHAEGQVNESRSPGDQALNSENYQVMSMLESLERKDLRPNLPYDQEEPEDITGSLMKLSELSLHDFLASEPDIYMVDDLKVRYR